MTDYRMIEQLAQLLDERGVEYETDERNATIKWSTYYGAFVFFARQREDKLLVETTVATEHSVILTPEQAVDATLGSGTCELVETDSYSNTNEVVHVLECSACGKSCEHVNGSYPKCPHCGRDV